MRVEVSKMLNKHKKIYIYIVLLLSAFLIAAGLAFASTSNLELKGTIFTNSLEPIAIIRDMKTDKINMYGKGEFIGSLQLVDVKRGEATL